MGQDESSNAVSSSTIGKVFYNAGDYATAERYFRDALVKTEHSKGQTSINTSLAMGDLAAALREERKYRDAEKLVTNSLTLRRSLVPANSPYLAGSLDNLGRTYLDTGRYVSAENAFLEARGILLTNYGFADASVRREDAILAVTQQKERTFKNLLTILLITPVIILGLTFLSELPVVRRVRSLSWALFLVSTVVLYGSKALAIFFGTFALMPLLMWVLPFPLDASQMRPVAGIIGGLSGLLAVFFLTQIAYLLRKLLKAKIGWATS